MNATALGVLPDDATPNGVQTLLALLAEHSHACVRQETRLDDLELRAVGTPTGPVLGPWLGVILLAGPALRITLKTFFCAGAIAGLLASRMRTTPDALAPSLVDDFIREFSNLCAGGVKRVLGEGGLTLGISLPLVTRGFDEVFNGAKAKREETRAIWTFARPGEAPLLKLAVSVVVLDEAALQAFAPPPPAVANAANDDDMEFL